MVLESPVRNSQVKVEAPLEIANVRKHDYRNRARVLHKYECNRFCSVRGGGGGSGIVLQKSLKLGIKESSESSKFYRLLPTKEDPVQHV